MLQIPEKYFIYLVVFLVASCAPSGGSDTSKNSIIVYNKSSYTVVAVYISSTSSFGWGSDWLKKMIPSAPTVVVHSVGLSAMKVMISGSLPPMTTLIFLISSYFVEMNWVRS